MSFLRRFAPPIVALLLWIPAGSVAETPDRTSRPERPFPARVELDRGGEVMAFLEKVDFNIDAVFDGWARVYVDQEEFEKLQRQGFAATRLPDDAPRMAELARLHANDDPGHILEGSVPAQYHTYATLTADLQQIAADHASIVRLVSIGQTVQGRELWFVKLTDNPDVEENEPGFTYISSMHGNEVVGKELLYNLIDYMTDNYGTDPRVTNLVDTTEIWIMPSMNPDGTELGQRWNANGVDLNRDFPDQFTDPINSGTGRAPETAAIMAWRKQHSSTLSLNMHGGALVANYPFDSNPAGSSTFSPAPDPDHDTFVWLARTYADNNPPMSISNAHPAWDNGITNGADWYAINGGLQDWQYVWYGDHEVLVEVSNTKWPSASELPGFWDDNLESMLAYMERVHEGVRGIVTDEDTGLPLAATIQIDTSLHLTYADPEVGDYHRVVVAGTYQLTVTAPSFETKIFPGVTVIAGAATVLDVQLGPLPVQLQPFGFDLQDAGNGYFDPGETSTLAVTLENLGRSATHVSAALIPTGYFGGAVQADANYPDIAPGATAQSIAPHYDVTLAAATPPGHRAGYALEWITDQGVGQSDPFFIDIGAPVSAVEVSLDVPYDIPVLPVPTFISSNLTYPMESEIVTVRVTIDLTHTYVGDLLIELISPAGTRVRLHDHNGGSADNIIGTYGVDLVPFESLSAFDGEMSSGIWRLEVTDDVLGDGGALNAWSLEIDGRPPEASPPEMKFRRAEIRPSGARFEWWPYPGLTSYRIYRSTDPSQAAAFVDVTAEDGDPTDTLFDDGSVDPVSYFLVTGVGANGEGPKGHFGE